MSSDPCCCRVCHGESEERRPLFYPCKCSGSIKYIHQDCLEEWLKISTKGSDRRCELCGERFKFRSIYAPGAPPQLTLYEFIQGANPRISNFANTIILNFFGGLMLFGLLPLFTSCWVNLCFSYILKEDFLLWSFMIANLQSITRLISTWWSGVVYCGIIAVVSVAALYVNQIISELRFEAEEVEVRENIPYVLAATRVNVHEDILSASEIDLTSENKSKAEETTTVHETDEKYVPSVFLCGKNCADKEDFVEEESTLSALHDEGSSNFHRKSFSLRLRGLDGLEQDLNSILAHSSENRSSYESYSGMNSSPHFESASDVCTPTATTHFNVAEKELDESGVEGLYPCANIRINSDSCSLSFHDGEVEVPRIRREIANENFNENLRHRQQVDVLHELNFVMDFSIQGFFYYLIFNVSVIFALQVFPVCIGRCLLSSFQKPDFFVAQVKENIMNVLQEHRLIAAQINLILDFRGIALFDGIAEETVYCYCTSILEWSVGCMLVLTFFCFILVFRYITIKRMNPLRIISTFKSMILNLLCELLKWAKISFFLTLEIAIIPQAVGWLLDISTLSALQTNIFDRIQYFYEMPVICFVAHWIVGVTFVLHVVFTMIELRGLVRPDLLQGLIPELIFPEFEDQIFHFFSSKTVLKLLLRELLMLCIFSVTIVFTVFIPVQLGHYVCPTLQPLKLNFNEVIFEVQLPLEMIVFHILVPLALERLQLRLILRNMLQRFLLFATKISGCENVLDVHEEEDINFALRNHVNGDQGNVVQRNILPAEQDTIDADNSEELKISEHAMSSSSLSEKADFDLVQSSEQGVLDSQRNFSSIKDMKECNYGPGFVLEAQEPMCVDNKEDLSYEENMLLFINCSSDESTQNCSKLSHSSSASSPLIAIVDYGPNSGGLVGSIDRSIFSWRTYGKYFKLVMLSSGALVLVSSWLIHLPLLLGRASYAALNVTMDHDIFNAVTGLVIIWTLRFLITYATREVYRDNLLTFMYSTGLWILKALKICALASAWISVVPFVGGLIFDVIAIVPVRVQLNETPKFPLIQSWALGLVFLKIWTRCLLLGAFGENEWKVRFDRIIARGFTNLDEKAIVEEILCPVFFALADYLVIPYFFGRCVAILNSSDFLFKTMVVRYSYGIYAASKIIYEVVISSYQIFLKVHDDIRDSRYLLGTELTNRQ